MFIGFDQFVGMVNMFCSVTMFFFSVSKPVRKLRKWSSCLRTDNIFETDCRSNPLHGFVIECSKIVFVVFFFSTVRRSVGAQRSVLTRHAMM